MRKLLALLFHAGDFAEGGLLLAGFLAGVAIFIRIGMGA